MAARKVERRRAAEVPITTRSLASIRHDGLRAEAEAALARGEQVRLLVGGDDPAARVETVVTSGGRAAQSSGWHVSRGTFAGGKVVTDQGGHVLDPDGCCFCRDCETAGGYTVDDDE